MDFWRRSVGQSLGAQRLVHRWVRALGKRVPIWYSPSYRLPLPTFETQEGAQLRRADFVAWYLVECGLTTAAELRVPARISYENLARVHTVSHLEALSQPSVLARIFASDPDEIVVEELLRAIRLVCGGTLEAARAAVRSRGPAINLGGGFHHAEPSWGRGFCAVNDIAVAIAVLRSEGFDGEIAVVDLDAHPPDGTVKCLQGDHHSKVLSLSGCDWGGLEGADETVLPRGTDDAGYLHALRELLGRVGHVDLGFVIQGGDVLEDDRLGHIAMSLDGALVRDALVKRAFRHVPSVWLPGGGYHGDSWRVLAATCLRLAGSPVHRPPSDYEPLDAHYALIADGLRKTALAGSGDISFDGMAADLGIARRHQRLLGYYTAEGVEFALQRYGILDSVGRLGYSDFRVEIDAGNPGDRARLFGHSGGREHLLIECSVQRVFRAPGEVLFVHWLTLRNPRATFGARRPRLPGQDVPGLGISAEFSVIFQRVIERLGLAGVVFTPSWYHMAHVARHHARFFDPARQGRFAALVKALAHLPLLDATCAVAEGQVLLNGEPYRWEPDEMMAGYVHCEADQRIVADTREHSQFTLVGDTRKRSI
jgi:acetoin utilization deacetylase AcuC-like enzyme